MYFCRRNERTFETDNRVGAAACVLRQDRHRDPYDRNGDSYSDLPKLRNLSVGVNAFVRPTQLSKLSVRYNIVNDEHRGGNNLGLQPHESNISEGASHLIHSGHLDYHIDFGHQHVEAYTALQHIRRNSYYGGIGEGTPEERIDALKAYGYTTNFTLATGALWRYHFDKLWFMPASLTVTGNFTGPMLVPHETEPPVLMKTQSFFVLNAQVSYDFHFKIQRKAADPMVQRPSEVGYNEVVLCLTAGVQNITNAYQPDLDYGVLRDAGYIYGPKQPRSLYLGFNVKI
jgi:hypothetical protein